MKILVHLAQIKKQTNAGPKVFKHHVPIFHLRTIEALILQTVSHNPLNTVLFCFTVYIMAVNGAFTLNNAFVFCIVLEPSYV